MSTTDLRRVCNLRDAHADVPYELPEDDSLPEANAFAIIASWKECARMVGWPTSAQQEIIREATNGDYSHLRRVIAITSTWPDEW